MYQSANRPIKIKNKIKKTIRNNRPIGQSTNRPIKIKNKIEKQINNLPIGQSKKEKKTIDQSKTNK
jgi:hypothetical protein